MLGMCDLAKIFFTSKFNYLFLSNPTNRTETGTPNRWGFTNNKPPGPIIMMANQKNWAAVRSDLLHSFLQVQSVAAPVTNYGNLWNYAEPNPFSWAKLAHLDFLHLILLCSFTHSAPLQSWSFPSIHPSHHPSSPAEGILWLPILLLQQSLFFKVVAAVTVTQQQLRLYYGACLVGNRVNST